MTRVLSLFLSIALPVWAQADPSILQIRILQGEGTVYSAGSRATRGVIVQVTDETGKPVEGAAVSFRLPEQGPTGQFSSGGRTEIVNTAADGRAEVWGMLWGWEGGAFDLRITAAKGASRAGMICSLYLSAALAPAITNTPERHGSSKKLWIAIGLAAAAGGAVLGVAGSNPPSPAGPAAIRAPQIGTPTITIGRP